MQRFCVTGFLFPCREYGFEDKKRTLFWVAVISLIASTPCLCGHPLAGEDLYGIALNVVTAWISYACFGKIFQKWDIGIICSALYTLSVFRIYRLFVAASPGEGTALAFLPLVLYGLYRIFIENPEGKGYRMSWVPFALGVSGVLQAHMLTGAITVLAVAAFCAFSIRKVFCRSTFLALFKGILAVLAVNLWVLVPFLDDYFTQDMHIKQASARTIQNWGIHFVQLAFHFWTTGQNVPSGDYGAQHTDPVGVGLVLAAALGFFLILWFSGAFRETNREKTLFAKRTAAVGLLLLFMSMNLFPWDRIQSLHPALMVFVGSLQYPDRFLGWGTVCLVFVFGFCLWYLDGCGKERHYWAMVAVAVIGITTSSMYLLDYVNSTQEILEQYSDDGMGFGSASEEEYLSQGGDVTETAGQLRQREG